MLNISLTRKLTSPLTTLTSLIVKKKEENLMNELSNILRNNGINIEKHSRREQENMIKGILDFGANDCNRILITIETLLNKDKRLEKREKENLEKLKRSLYRGYLSNTDRRRDGQAAIRFKQLEKAARQIRNN